MESSKNVNEILNSNYKIQQIYATKNWIEKYKIRDDISINQVNKNELQRISSLKTASDVLAVVHIPLEKSDFDFSGINIVLDDVKDPGNLGTIIRICDWFGVKNIYCSEETVDVYNPKVVQSTMGSITRVDVIYTNIRRMIQEVAINVEVYGAVMDGDDINQIKVNKNSLIVFGNESNGISKEIKDIISERITINKIGEAESLNVASSAAIILNKFCN
ncbi:MAG: RNA methyltransferase [Flavobacteriales bacterium]|mgnify:FL=1|nr:RNA methyltransferase [Flavobacteriales bacterium]MBT6699544.1 RNA methyltransferase [Flavobacteriales bacterium]MBT6815697.1 RNA methyltransferase [Flavobacteriales bacterium]